MKNEMAPTLIREKKGKSCKDIVMCVGCQGFFSRRFYYRHQKHCITDTDENAAHGVPVSLIAEAEVHPRFADVLARLSDDDVGKLCKSDPMILEVGRKHYQSLSRKPDKQMEVRKSTMTLMRTLARLYLSFRPIAGKDNMTAEHMLDRSNFKHLELAIYEVSDGEGDIKSGMKLAYGYALKTAAKVMEGVHLMRNDDSKAELIKKFVTILNMQWASVFGDAEYRSVQNRNHKLRKPSALPLEEDINKVRDYTVNAVAAMMSDAFLHWSSVDFARLRDLIVSRLTMFNARRGGEPSRLLVTEWDDAEKGVWISESAVQGVTDGVSKELLSNYKVAFQSGKGSKRDVPILIPLDCREALKKLSQQDFRQSVSIHPDNPYVFASTHRSKDHVIGWNAVSQICGLAGVSTKLTATKMRHRASTIYASKETSETEREAFYRHMGHSAEINKSVYQCPLALQEIVSVGQFFDQLDRVPNIGQAATDNSLVLSLTSTKQLLPSIREGSVDILGDRYEEGDAILADGSRNDDTEIQNTQGINGEDLFQLFLLICLLFVVFLFD